MFYTSELLSRTLALWRRMQCSESLLLTLALWRRMQGFVEVNRLSLRRPLHSVVNSRTVSGTHYAYTHTETMLTRLLRVAVRLTRPRPLARGVVLG